jgi:hypothetical protein
LLVPTDKMQLLHLPFRTHLRPGSSRPPVIARLALKQRLRPEMPTQRNLCGVWATEIGGITREHETYSCILSVNKQVVTMTEVSRLSITEDASGHSRWTTR